MSSRLARTVIAAFLCAAGAAAAGYGVVRLGRGKMFGHPRAYTIAAGKLYMLEKGNRLLEFEHKGEGRGLRLLRETEVAKEDSACYYIARKLYAGHDGVVVHSYIYEQKTDRFLGYRVQEYLVPGRKEPKELLTVRFETPGKFPELRYAAGPAGVHYFSSDCEGRRNIWKVAPEGEAIMRNGEVRGIEELGEINGPLVSWTSICVGPEGNLYLTSGAEGVIVEYSPQGERLQTIGSIGFEPGQLLAPEETTFLELDGRRMLTVAAMGNRTWVVFDATGGTHRVISPLEEGYPMRDILVARPGALGAEGRICAVDLANRLVVDVFNPARTWGGYRGRCSAEVCVPFLLAVFLFGFGLAFPGAARFADRLKFPLFIKLLLLFIPLLLLSSMIAADQAKDIVKADLEAESLKRLANLANAALNSISMEDLKAIQAPQDRQSAAYERIYSAVSRVIEPGKVQDTPKWILHKIKDGRFYFGVNVWRGAIYEPFIVPQDRKMFFEAVEKKQPSYGRFADEQGEWFSYLAPVADENGEAIYVLELYRPAEQLDRADARVTCRILKAIGALSLFSALLVLVFSFVTTRPLRRLMEAAARVGKGNLDYRITTRAHDETRDLADAFNNMTAELKSYVAKLAQTAAEKERFAVELQFAREVQLNMLPKIFPPCDGMENVEITARIRPAKEVGGDYYDFFLVDDRHVGMVIADVSGKGVPAGLFMSATRTLLRSHAMGNTSAAKALARVNRMMAAENASSMFVTMFYFVCDMRTGMVTWCNAGHNPPVWLKSDGLQVLRAEPGMAVNLPIGVLEEARYHESQLRLQPGESLFLYTDGITEACSRNEKFFGEKAMLDLLAASLKADNAEKAKRLEKAVMAFQTDADQADDMTMVFFKLKSVEPDAVTL